MIVLMTNFCRSSLCQMTDFPVKPSPRQGKDTLTSQARAYAHFQIVLVLGEEVWPYAIYTRDERRSFCAWVVFLPKTTSTQS